MTATLLGDYLFDRTKVRKMAILHSPLALNAMKFKTFLFTAIRNDLKSCAVITIYYESERIKIPKYFIRNAVQTTN